MIRAFALYHVERKNITVFENSGVCIYIRNQVAEYPFASHLISQSILTMTFANTGIMQFSSGFCTFPRDAIINYQNLVASNNGNLLLLFSC